MTRHRHWGKTVWCCLTSKNKKSKPTSGHLKIDPKNKTTTLTDTKNSFATRDHEAKEQSQDKKTTSGNLKIIDFPLVLFTSRNSMFFKSSIS